MASRDSSLRCVELCADLASRLPVEGKHLVIPLSMYHEIVSAVESWFEERGGKFSRTENQGS